MFNMKVVKTYRTHSTLPDGSRGHLTGYLTLSTERTLIVYYVKGFTHVLYDNYSACCFYNVLFLKIF